MPALSGSVAVVTGGASGIGRATAMVLARHGALVLTGDLEPRAENDEAFGALDIKQRRCDVRLEEDVRRLIDEATQCEGVLRILVNSAGVGLVKQIPDVTEAEWDVCFDTNLKGAFFTSKHAIPHMRTSDGGAIVNIASNAGLLPRAHDPVYSTSKAAWVALTESLALCHAEDKIRVNCVCPGPVSDTGMMEADLKAADDPEALRRQLIDASPLARARRRMVTPEEVAQAVLYLVSEASMMVTGTAVRIDGGKSLGVPPAGGAL